MNIPQYATLLFILLHATLRYPFYQSSTRMKTARKASSPTDIALMYGVLICTVILPVLWACTNVFAFADYRGTEQGMWTGLSLRLLAAFFFYRSHKDLGSNWSDKLELRTEHSLVSNGIYKYVRHPMYASMLLALAAQCLYLTNYIIAPLAFLSYFVLYLHRAPQEEKMMEQQFGEQYMHYKQQTGALIPGL